MFQHMIKNPLPQSTIVAGDCIRHHPAIVCMFGVLAGVLGLGAMSGCGTQRSDQTTAIRSSAIASATQAADQLEQQVRNLLTKEDDRERAWGAWLAGQYRLEALQPEVIAVATRPSAKGEQSPSYGYYALGLLSGTVSSAVLSRLDNPTVAMIVAARSPADHESWICAHIPSTGNTFTAAHIAAANLAITLGNTESVTALASGISATLAVRVYDNFNISSGGGRRIHHGPFHKKDLIGYPPRLRWELSAKPSAWQVADGPISIFANHMSDEVHTLPQPLFNDIAQWNSYRCGCICCIAGVPSSVRLQPEIKLSIRWTTAAACSDAIIAEIQAIQSDWERVATALLKREIFASGIPPALHLSMSDVRSDENVSIPLPTVDAITNAMRGMIPLPPANPQ